MRLPKIQAKNLSFMTGSSPSSLYLARIYHLTVQIINLNNAQNFIFLKSIFPIQHCNIFQFFGKKFTKGGASFCASSSSVGPTFPSPSTALMSATIFSTIASWAIVMGGYSGLGWILGFNGGNGGLVGRSRWRWGGRVLGATWEWV